MKNLYQCAMLTFLLAALAQQATAQTPPAEPEAEEQEFMPFEFTEADMPKYDAAELARSIVYPAEALSARLEGKVILEFIVDTDGRAMDVIAISSTNPIFNEASITAVQGLRFVPATMHGEPVRVRMSIPIIYSLSVDTPIMVEGRMTDTVPQYDRQEVARHVEYPAEARKNGVEGTVVVSAHIDWKGNVVSTLVESSDSPLLNDAARAAVTETAFMPAYKRGKPVDAWISVPVTFVLQ